MAKENDNGQEKTLDPSEQRKKEYREKGQVPRSRDLVSTFALSATGASMLIWAGMLGKGFSEIFYICLGDLSGSQMDSLAVMHLFTSILRAMAIMLSVPLGTAFVVVVVVEGIQSRGALNTKEPLKVDWTKLDPIQGFKTKFISWSPVVELGKGLLKLFLIGWLIWSGMEDRLGLLPAMMDQEPEVILLVYKEIAWMVLVRAMPLALVIAVLDYAYQWYEMQHQMMMTRQEVKDEHKKSEGDPKLKGQRRRRAREIAMAQTVQNVGRADLVITNPTHFAVALRYNKEEAPAPIVVAKGVDHLALKIRLEATRLDIPQVENRPLARALYYECREGQPIPEELYGAVARVLAVIWRRKRKSGRPTGDR